MTEDNPSRICSMGDFVMDVSNHDQDTFTRLHGEAFLLFHGNRGSLARPFRTGGTVAVDTSPTSENPVFNPQRDFLVFPVCKREAGHKLIWLGRSEGNDIIIPDSSVSAVHAFLEMKTQDKLTMFSIQDGGSRNGTYVNGREVAKQGEGEPTPIESGARIQLGNLQLFFLRSDEFYLLISRMFN
jgi:hypothetical protein